MPVRQGVFEGGVNTVVYAVYRYRAAENINVLALHTFSGLFNIERAVGYFNGADGFKSVIARNNLHGAAGNTSPPVPFLFRVGGFNSIFLGVDGYLTAQNVHIVFAFNPGFYGVHIQGSVGDHQPASGMHPFFMVPVHRQRAFPGEGQVRGGVDRCVWFFLTSYRVLLPITDSIGGASHRIYDCRAASGGSNSRPRGVSNTHII